MTTISSNTTVGITLNPALYTSPVVIRTGVTITNTGGDGVTSFAGTTQEAA